MFRFGKRVGCASEVLGDGTFDGFHGDFGEVSSSRFKAVEIWVLSPVDGTKQHVPSNTLEETNAL